MIRVAVWAVLLVGVVGTAPGPVPVPVHGVPADATVGGNESCGQCVVAMCPIEMYTWDKLAWFDHNCEDRLDPSTIMCIDYVAQLLGTGKAHEVEHDVPYAIITIFSSFGLGAIIRHYTKDSDVPYTVILFIVGFAWGALSKVSFLGLEASAAIYNINPHLIFHIFLPVLIFESAFAMEIPIFRKVIGHCIVLAAPGLMVAATMTGALAKLVFTDYNWNWYACLLFGTILSATDPVAVVALLKELGASPVVSTLIEGESLFNDGTAIVFFHVLVEAIQTKSCSTDWSSCVDQCFCQVECSLDKSIFAIVGELLRVALGGAFTGLIIGMISVAVLNRVFNDALIEITLTFVAAYITFFVSEVFLEFSGVLAVCACGCFMSYYRHCISPEVTHTMHEFWEITVHLTNTLIFILAGIIAYIKAFQDITPTDVGYLAVTYVGINVIRFAVLLLFYYPMNKFFSYKIDKGNLCLIAWGGLRGAVGLALSLVIQADESVAVPYVRDKFVFHVAGICILTLCINGTTTQYLVSYFKLNAIEERKRLRMNEVWHNLLKEQDEDLRELRANPILYDTNWEQVGRYSDLRLAIGTRNEDPYNHIGWKEKRNWNCTDAEVAHKERVEGKAVYLASVKASLENQYKFGTLRRQGIRHVTKEIARSKEMKITKEVLWTDTLIQASWIKQLFMPSRLEETIAVTPGMREWLMKWRWQNAFDVSLAVIEAHKVTCSTVKAICKRNVSNDVDTHCKRAKNEIIKALAEAAAERPDISTSLKTRSACRNILNTMEAIIVQMKHEARLDNQDAAALRAILKERMKRVTHNLSRSMPQSEAFEILEGLSWYKAAGRKTQLLFMKYAKESVITVPENETLTSHEYDGLIVVIVGIVQLRVGRKIFKYGSEYTAGWNKVLTGHDRFNELCSESGCTLLVIPTNVVAKALQEDAAFAAEAWRCCGMNTARCLMAIDDTYDPKVWDDKAIRKSAESGYIVVLQDPDAYDFKNERRHPLHAGYFRCLLRGKCWEYGEERDHIGGSLCRFPTLIPPAFRFATFTEHAVLFEMEAPTSASIRARSLWGKLKTKIKSIYIWSNLRGAVWGRACLALAFGTKPLEELPAHYKPVERVKEKEMEDGTSASKEESINLARSSNDDLDLGSDSNDTPPKGALPGLAAKREMLGNPLLLQPASTTGPVSYMPAYPVASSSFSPLSTGLSQSPRQTFMPPAYPSHPSLPVAKPEKPATSPLPPAPVERNLVLPTPPDFRKILEDIEREEARVSPISGTPSFANLMMDATRQANSKIKPKTSKASSGTAGSELSPGKRLSL